MNYIKLKAYYLDDLEKFGGKKIWEKVTVRGIGLSQKCIHQAYKEMEKIEFRGNIIDYLGYICLSDVISHIEIPKMAGISTKNIMIFMEIYLGSERIIEDVICRLLLKDMTYLNDAFKEHKLINLLGEDSGIFNAVKTFFEKRINFRMHYGEDGVENPYESLITNKTHRIR